MFLKIRNIGDIDTTVDLTYYKFTTEVKSKIYPSEGEIKPVVSVDAKVKEDGEGKIDFWIDKQCKDWKKGKIDFTITYLDENEKEKTTTIKDILVKRKD